MKFLFYWSFYLELKWVWPTGPLISWAGSIWPGSIDPLGPTESVRPHERLHAPLALARAHPWRRLARRWIPANSGHPGRRHQHQTMRRAPLCLWLASIWFSLRLPTAPSDSLRQRFGFHARCRRSPVKTELPDAIEATPLVLWCASTTRWCGSVRWCPAPSCRRAAVCAARLWSPPRPPLYGHWPLGDFHPLLLSSSHTCLLNLDMLRYLSMWVEQMHLWVQLDNLVMLVKLELLLLAVLIKSSELNHTNDPLGQIPSGVALWLGDLYFSKFDDFRTCLYCGHLS